MRLVSFEHEGRQSYGLVEGERIVDIGAVLSPRLPDLRAALTVDLLAELPAARSRATAIDVSSVRFLPVIPNPSKIICVGLNYVSHRTETKRAETAHPALFTRFADSQVGHGEPIVCPSFSKAFDFEGELAVVIGRGGSDITEKDALSHVAGYACYNDVTVRDWQRHTTQWLPGKNFPATGAFGPCLVTPDEIDDIGSLVLRTRLNGEVMQEAPIADLIFSIPVLISYISRFTPLSTGDVIATGTPGGVGDRREPPVYMKAGDVIEVEIDRVGALTNVVVVQQRQAV